MRIAMIGTGYLGLVSETCFADFGHHVTCVDKDQSKINALLAGTVPIWEPGLDSLVATNVSHRRLALTTDLAQAIGVAEAVFIAVGTPSRRGDGHADLSYVFAAIEELAKALDHAVVVVTKSTVPVGTGDRIAELLKEHGAPEGCSVASNPEFLRESAAIADFKHPDRHPPRAANSGPLTRKLAGIGASEPTWPGVLLAPETSRSDLGQITGRNGGRTRART